MSLSIKQSIIVGLNIIVATSTRKTVGSISSKKSRKGEIKGVRNIKEKTEQFETQKNDFFFY